MSRNDLARPRSHFRIVQDGTLVQKHCPSCKGVLYRVPEGTWLHWTTLEEACPSSGSETVEKMAYGPTLAERTPSVLDSPERGLARARCAGSYRRPSWEWMACG